MAYEGQERRKHKRIKVSFVVSYRPLEKEDDADLSQTKNFSQGGMLLTTNKAFGPGTLLKIFIRVPLVKGKIYLIGQVLESKEIVKNLIYETRIAFQNLEDEIERILHETVGSFLEGKK
ncbi:MAG: PilZ domain-containing protein [Candidatus Omnitrophica bacterium]|nr:PilZ domain-containing protein [Candidatus Omnitrophota bacterium]